MMLIGLLGLITLLNTGCPESGSSTAAVVVADQEDEDADDSGDDIPRMEILSGSKSSLWVEGDQIDFQIRNLNMSRLGSASISISGVSIEDSCSALDASNIRCNVPDTIDPGNYSISLVDGTVQTSHQVTVRDSLTRLEVVRSASQVANRISLTNYQLGAGETLAKEFASHVRIQRSNNTHFYRQRLNGTLGIATVEENFPVFMSGISTLNGVAYRAEWHAGSSRYRILASSLNGTLASAFASGGTLQVSMAPKFAGHTVSYVAPGTSNGRYIPNHASIYNSVDDSVWFFFRYQSGAGNGLHAIKIRNNQVQTLSDDAKGIEYHRSTMAGVTPGGQNDTHWDSLQQILGGSGLFPVVLPSGQVLIRGFAFNSDGSLSKPVNILFSKNYNNQTNESKSFATNLSRLISAEHTDGYAQSTALGNSYLRYNGQTGHQVDSNSNVLYVKSLPNGQFVIVYTGSYDFDKVCAVIVKADGNPTHRSINNRKCVNVSQADMLQHEQHGLYVYAETDTSVDLGLFRIDFGY